VCWRNSSRAPQPLRRCDRPRRRHARAAYARKEDTFSLLGHRPEGPARRAAKNFTYVAESAGKVDLILRDGRKALEESKQDYDVIVIDAFTGDGVPSHLLTREAYDRVFQTPRRP